MREGEMRNSKERFSLPKGLVALVFPVCYPSGFAAGIQQLSLHSHWIPLDVPLVFPKEFIDPGVCCLESTGTILCDLSACTFFVHPLLSMS